MPPEPETKRAVAFVDGQNLFHAVREAFGYSYPNYDVSRLVSALCERQGWRVEQVRFYTGVPDIQASPRWHGFWERKLAVMGTRRIRCFSRPLRYRHETVLVGGVETPVLVGREKGIDVRIALDIVRMAHNRCLDVALIFSQDQDLSEVADEVREISKQQGRWIKVASAFPVSPTYDNRRGINGADWIRIDRATYDACLDPLDYRPKDTRK